MIHSLARNDRGVKDAKPVVVPTQIVSDLREQKGMAAITYSSRCRPIRKLCKPVFLQGQGGNASSTERPRDTYMSDNLCDPGVSTRFVI